MQPSSFRRANCCANGVSKLNSSRSCSSRILFALLIAASLDVDRWQYSHSLHFGLLALSICGILASCFRCDFLGCKSLVAFLFARRTLVRWLIIAVHKKLKLRCSSLLVCFAQWIAVVGPFTFTLGAQLLPKFADILFSTKSVQLAWFHLAPRC